jgi:hypothetical protein
MKTITINAPDGQYNLSVTVVAHDRASYYRGMGESYVAAFNETCDDDYEIIDWLLNNMNWSDVSADAVKVSDKILVLEEDFWTDSDDFEVV